MGITERERAEGEKAQGKGPVTEVYVQKSFAATVDRLVDCNALTGALLRMRDRA